MDRNQSYMAHKVFPTVPDRTALYPAAGQQRILAALQQDIAARRHLLCLIGPPGSGKTVLLRALRKNLKQGLVGVIEQPTPGRLLADVAKSLQLDASEENESLLRRRLVMLLAMVDQQKQPIIQIIDAADTLSTEDFNLLLHFFPSGHATLILASEHAPETWFAGCATATGEARIDQCYRLEPWPAEETAGYIRHRLRAASLPDNVFPPATLDAIHREGRGLPGGVNQASAAALEQSAAQATGQVVPPVPEPRLESAADAELSPAIQTEREVERETEPEPASPFNRIAMPSRTVPNQTVPNESVWANAGAAQHIDRRRRESTLRTVVPANEVHYEEERLSLRTRRLRRSVRLWRVATVLAGAALALVLTQDLWLSRLGLDRSAADAITEQRIEHSPAADSVPESAAESAVSAPPVATASVPGSGDPSSDFAALQEPSSANEPSEQPLLPGPRNTTAAPLMMSDPMPVTEPQPQFESSSGQEPVSELEANPPAAVARSEPVRKRNYTATLESRSERESPRLTRSQRREVARLYAERAEYEWRNGDVNAAAMSIQRGLASDPRDPRLLEMRALLHGVQEP